MSIITKIQNAQTHNELSDVVNEYLLSIGESLEFTAHETYGETAERLDNDVMRLAEQRWFAIDEQ